MQPSSQQFQSQARPTNEMMNFIFLYNKYEYTSTAIMNEIVPIAYVAGICFVETSNQFTDGVYTYATVGDIKIIIPPNIATFPALVSLHDFGIIYGRNIINHFAPQLNAIMSSGGNFQLHPQQVQRLQHPRPMAQSGTNSAGTGVPGQQYMHAPPTQSSFAPAQPSFAPTQPSFAPAQPNPQPYPQLQPPPQPQSQPPPSDSPPRIKQIKTDPEKVDTPELPDSMKPIFVGKNKEKEADLLLKAKQMEAERDADIPPPPRRIG